MVVVHYGTDDLTIRSLRAIVDDDLSPPTTVVVVDNGPGAPLEPRVRRELPSVEVVTPGRNLGFAGGCNVGIAHLPDVRYVALVNSDAIVHPGWLVPLVQALDADSGLGAAAAKLCFEGLFHELSVATDDAWVPGRGDPRRLAWHLEGVTADGVDVTDRCLLVEGFWEPDATGVWAGPSARLLVPAGGGAGLAVISCTRPSGCVAPLVVAQGTDAEPAKASPRGVAVYLAGEPVRVINNVGNAWRPDGYGIDLGYQEVDAGQHDAPTEVPAWCGGAVLLRRTYLNAVGSFDERLFLYYDDLELSRRGVGLGWRYQLCPTSVVEHRHGASSTAGSAETERLKERNRLLVMLRHDGVGAYARQLLRFVLVTLSYIRRDVVAPLRRGRRPQAAIVRVRLGAVAGAVRWAPAMLVTRRQDRRRRQGRVLGQGRARR